jgi:anaerobic magnesium-protoporphyrin IX monomethyl ester cyclase
MSDIVLIYPKTGNDVTTSIAPPHSLLAIAAIPDKMGMKVKIIDQRVEPLWADILLKELESKPSMVGISTMTGSQIKYAMDAAQFIRLSQWGVPIVWGGKHPSLLPQQTLDSGLADAVCVGDGDYQLYYNVMRKNLKGIWQTDRIVYPDDLMDTPWHLIDIEKYIHPDMYLKDSPRTLDIGQTSRGCPFHCKFCSQGNERWRAMSVDRSVHLIKDAVKRFNLTGVWIRDDEFYVNTNRAVAICEKLIPLGIKWYTSGTRIDIFNRTPLDAIQTYKRGGASVLKFGAESGSNRILDFIGKKITREDTLLSNIKAKESGIIPAYNFMAGFPTETFAEINESVDLMLQLKRENPAIHLETLSTFCAMPGTEMYQIAIEYGLKPPGTLTGWINWRFDEYDDSGTRIPWMNRRERRALGNLCYLSIMANTMPNLLSSYDHSLKGSILKAGYTLPQRYFNWRFENKSYHFMPELRVIKGMRGVLSK